MSTIRVLFEYKNNCSQTHTHTSIHDHHQYSSFLILHLWSTLLFTFGRHFLFFFLIFFFGRIQKILGKKIPSKYEYEHKYYSIWENYPNTNNILVEKVTRIRIQMLAFGLNYLNDIWIPNYSVISDSHQIWSLQGVHERLATKKHSYCTHLNSCALFYMKSMDACFSSPGSIFLSTEKCDGFI